MTEQEKAVSMLKDNIVLAALTLIRNLDTIVGFDPRPMVIEISSEPYKDSTLNFYRKKFEEVKEDDGTSEDN